MINASTVFKKAASPVSCQMNDEVAILDLDRSLYFGLEGAAVQIWTALDQPRSVSELCDGIVAAFEVSRAACEADTIQLLTDLQREGLIETAA